MNADKVRQDSTPSTRGTIFQLCVAVEKCYELREGQRLLIEELGDVTIEDDQQIEVKQYSDRLTDGHHNLWNTLKNWLDDGFDHTQYPFLILHTTQEFGPKATIAEWNGLDAEKRLNLLLAINKNFEEAYEAAKPARTKKRPSAVLRHQRFALAPKRRAKLDALIRKVSIEAQAKDLPDLYEELKQMRIRGVLQGKKDDYLNSLIGFVCRPNKIAGESWVITYEDFDAKVCILNAQYNNETRQFPRKHFGAQRLEDGCPDRDDLFVKKIRKIAYPEVIWTAISDFEATLATLHQEFKAYAIDPATVESYSSDVTNRFKAAYRTACRKCSNSLEDSKTLYDETTGSPASVLAGFGDTPDGFRNGLLHQGMDNPCADLKWMVSKNE